MCFVMKDSCTIYVSFSLFSIPSTLFGFLWDCSFGHVNVHGCQTFKVKSFCSNYSFGFYYIFVTKSKRYILSNPDTSQLLHVSQPFRLTTWPRVFTKVLSQVMGFLRWKDVQVYPFLDNILVVAGSSVFFVGIWI